MTNAMIEILEKHLQEAERHLDACQSELMKALENELHELEGKVWPDYIWRWARPIPDIEKDIDKTNKKIAWLKGELNGFLQIDGSFLDDLEIDLEF